MQTSILKIPEVEIFKILKKNQLITQRKLVYELVDAMSGQMAYNKAFYFIKSLYDRPFKISSKNTNTATEPLIEQAIKPDGLSLKQVIKLNEKWEQQELHEVEDIFLNHIYPRLSIGNRS